jgi:hypothetical protein
MLCNNLEFVPKHRVDEMLILGLLYEVKKKNAWREAMSICDLVLIFTKLDTGALYKKLSSEHDSCSKHQLSGSHKDKNQFLSILSIPPEQHNCNAILQISIQYCSTTVSVVTINAVQAILYFEEKIKFCTYFLHSYPTCTQSNTEYGQFWL